MAITGGKLVVFEGLDGAGCKTQAKMFYSHAVHAFGKNKVVYLSYPAYNHWTGKLIKSHLKGKLAAGEKEAFLLFLLDQMNDAETIRNAMKKGKLVIIHRYYTSNIAYHAPNISIKDAFSLVKMFGLPRPDILYYIDVRPKTAHKRKKRQKRKLDIYEKDLRRLSKARSNYFKLAFKHKELHGWQVINGERPKADIAEDVWSRFLKGK